MRVPVSIARRAAIAICVATLSAPAGAAESPAARDFDSPDVARDFDATSVPDPRISDAESAIRARDWDRAIRILHLVVVDVPDSADAYNYLGYSYRRRGDHQQALIYYRQALYLDPEHRGALEYLGELYLDMSDIEKAEEQLARLSRVCGGTCSEYRDLREQVQRVKSGQPRG